MHSGRNFAEVLSGRRRSHGQVNSAGDAFSRDGFYGPALALCRHVAGHHGDHPRAITAQGKVVATHINLNDEPAAQQNRGNTPISGKNPSLVSSGMPVVADF